MKTAARHPEDDAWLRWQAVAPRIYDEVYYRGHPIVRRVNESGHVAAEADFPPEMHCANVLEVGAGTGFHLQYVRHSYDAYHLTDLSEAHLERARERNAGRQGLVIERQDALSLSYDDGRFDRLISIYNLEHLPEPHLALKEWRRVVKRGGYISIAIPTEGGIAWNLGRYLTTRRTFARLGLDLDYIIAREHINACYRLVSLLRHYFPDRKERWLPFRVPSPHVNLVFACTIRNS